jgi:FkbM family methyltransferase
MRKYNALVATDIGTFIINKNDLGVGWQLSEYGTYDPNELEALKGLFSIIRDIKPNLVALDVGANIGIHSVVLSGQVGPKGIVYAFEAQRIIFNMLAGNIAINSLSNVVCLHNAVGDTPGFIDIPIFDYGKPMSFGSIEFGGYQREDLGQKRQSGKSEKVQVTTIDQLNLDEIDFIKIDVEGMEINVLKGAQESIAKFRPFMLIEYLKSCEEEIVSYLKTANYIIYSGIGANYLAIPKEAKLTIDDLTIVA